MEHVMAGPIGLALLVVAVLGAMVRAICSKPPTTGRRAPRPPRTAENGAGDVAHERGARPRRSSPRPTIVGALLVAAVATFGAGGNATAGDEEQGRAGDVRIVIDSVATSAVIPNQAVVQVVAAATAGESYLAAHHLAQLTHALLERAGWQTATGRRADVEIVLRARQAAVGGDASGMPVLGRWVQLAVVQPRSQAELWSGTAMSIGGCTLGEIGEVLVDELIGRIGTAGTVHVLAAVPALHRRADGCNG